MATKKWIDLTAYDIHAGIENDRPVLVLMAPGSPKSETALRLIGEANITLHKEGDDTRTVYSLTTAELVRLKGVLPEAAIRVFEESFLSTPFVPAPIVDSTNDVDAVADEASEPVAEEVTTDEAGDLPVTTADTTTSEQEQAVVSAETEEGAADEAVAEETGQEAGKAVKHTDVGRKIGGARKDLYSSRETFSLYSRFKNNELDQEEFLEQITTLEKVNVKNNIWPKPDWNKLREEEGLTAQAAAFIKLTRDSLAAKPTIGKYAADTDRIAAHLAYPILVAGIRDRVMGVRNDEDIKNLIREARDFGEHSLAAKFWLPEDQDLSDEVIQTTMAHRFAAQKNRRGIISYTYPHQYIENERGVAHGKALTHTLNGDAIESWDFVMPGRNRTESSNRNSEGPVMPVPHLEHVERIGPDYRQGKDITGEDLMETFGFSGIEYGNWVPNKERQEILNHAYDALKDLAFITGLPDKALALDGRLALAFGSRGRSKALAHYEPGYKVINLTRMKGAGSLAHEWAHALDHYMSDKYKNELGVKLLSNEVGDYAGEPPEAQSNESLQALAIELAKDERLAKEDQAYTYKNPKSNQPYQRYGAALGHVLFAMLKADKTKEQAIEEVEKTFTDYAAHAASWIVNALSLAADTQEERSEIWRSKDFRVSVAEAIKDIVLANRYINTDELIEKLIDSNMIKPIRRGRNGTITSTCVEQIDLSIRRIHAAMHRVDLIQNGNRMGLGVTQTDYFKNALTLDKGKAKYWATNSELFARAFEAWTMDSLAKENRKSDYLSGHAVEGVYSNPEAYKGDPYLYGDERQLVNSMMDTLMSHAVACNKFEALRNDDDLAAQIDEDLESHTMAIVSRPA